MPYTIWSLSREKYWGGNSIFEEGFNLQLNERSSIIKLDWKGEFKEKYIGALFELALKVASNSNVRWTGPRFLSQF